MENQRVSPKLEASQFLKFRMIVLTSEAAFSFMQRINWGIGISHGSWGTSRV